MKVITVCEITEGKIELGNTKAKITGNCLTKRDKEINQTESSRTLPC